MLTIDLSRHCATVECGGTRREYALRNTLTTAYWSSRSFTFQTQAGKTVCATWKLWAGLEQFVELEMYEANQWVCVGQWSYVARPQSGTSQTSSVRCLCPSEYAVRVVGSPHGAFASAQATA